MKKKVAIISHDAGGAELVSLWAKKQKYDYITHIYGPARKVFERNALFENHYNLKDAILKSDWILCGTSWQSEIEKEAILNAKLLKKKSVSLLDHWVNYRERYIYKGNLNLPDEIWVTDNYAKNLIIKEFPKVKIRLVKNMYFENMKKKINSIKLKYQIKKNTKKNILFLAQNFSETSIFQIPNHKLLGYNEHDAINFLLENIDYLGVKINTIQIRPHPSDKDKKYDWVLKKYPQFKFINSRLDLIEDIVKSDIVVGCTTMGLAIACLAKKKVISCIPRGPSECPIPFKEIINFREIIKEKSELK